MIWGRIGTCVLRRSWFHKCFMCSQTLPCIFPFLDRMSQRSVSGNSKIGCNAVIIAGLRHRKISLDAYDMLDYCATTKEGGGSLLTSYMKCLPVRVFRSSTYNSIYRANNKTTCCCSRCRANGFASPHPQSPKKTVQDC